MQLITRLAFTGILLLLPVNFLATPLPQTTPNISVNGSLASNKVGRGRTVKGTVTMDIPSGYHTHSNRPLEKFLIATKLQFDPPGGIRVGPVSYPRPLLRSLKFSKKQVSVFEGRTTMRFNVTIPPNYQGNSGELKGRLTFQSCNDELCFRPETREVKIWFNVE
jgi:DsbC/DsbD-like thiol-disulfide interchange protein